MPTVTRNCSVRILSGKDIKHPRARTATDEKYTKRDGGREGEARGMQTQVRSECFLSVRLRLPPQRHAQGKPIFNIHQGRIRPPKSRHTEYTLRMKPRRTAFSDVPMGSPTPSGSLRLVGRQLISVSDKEFRQFAR